MDLNINAGLLVMFSWMVYKVQNVLILDRYQLPPEINHSSPFQFRTWPFLGKIHFCQLNRVCIMMNSRRVITLGPELEIDSRVDVDASLQSTAIVHTQWDINSIHIVFPSSAGASSRSITPTSSDRMFVHLSSRKVGLSYPFSSHSYEYQSFACGRPEHKCHRTYHTKGYLFHLLMSCFENCSHFWFSSESVLTRTILGRSR